MRVAGLLTGCLLVALLGVFTPVPAAEARMKPVIFIHGLNRSDTAGSNCAKDFTPMRRAFRRWGHDGRFTAVAYYRFDRNCNHWIAHHGRHRRHFGGDAEHYDAGGHSANTDIRHLGFHLARYIWSHYSKRGREVDVVGHSMGGLIIRYALAQTQRGEAGFPPRLLVDDVVTMGTPHGGARWYAIGCRYDQCGQMQAGSDFLVWLENNAWNPQGAGGTDWSTFGSDDDNAVAADRAAATARDRSPVSDYMGSCHKVWYRDSTQIEHSEFLNITSRRITADVFRRNCPHRFVTDNTSHWPVRRAFLAITSRSY